MFHADGIKLHSGIPLKPVALAAMLDMVFLAVLLAFCLRIFRRRKQWPTIVLAVAGLLFSLLPWDKIYGLAWLFLPGWVSANLPALSGSPDAAAIVLVASIAGTTFGGIRWLNAGVYQKLAAAGGLIVAGFGVFGIVALWQLSTLISWRPPAFATGKIAASGTPKPDADLLIWIVFDELSHKQTFGSRAAHIALPNFDALRRISTLYEQVIPNSSHTETAIPSMFLGEHVAQVTLGAANRELYKSNDAAVWQYLEARRTVFGNARQARLHIALAGWYNPYCEMLEGTLDSCWCSQAHSVPYPFSSEGTWRNAFNLLRDLVARALWPARGRANRDNARVQQQLKAYREVYSHAVSLLNAPGYDFIFLHLPVPHPPGIYDRRTGNFTARAGRSYLDNLALADRTLGEFMALLQKSPRWARTSLIVNSDHAWRVQMWREMNLVTAEDEVAAQGPEDQRPVLMVHKAGQLALETVSAPVQLTGIHDVVLSMLPHGHAATVHSNH